MVSGPLDWEWGEWVLGDLSDVLRRACEAVGRATAVERVTVEPPPSPDAVPQVTLWVLEERIYLGLRVRLAQGEYPVTFVEEITDQSWVAEVAGVRLVVALESGGPR